MFAEIVAPLFYGLLFLLIIRHWKFFRIDGLKSSVVLSAFLLKIFGGLVFWWVYTYYYVDPTESDAFRYFSDTMLIREQWNSNREVFWSFMLGRHMDHPEYVRIYDQLIAWTSAYRYGLSNDCSTIIRINVIVSFISFGSFHVHSLFMSFFAFTGLTAIYKTFQNMFVGRRNLLIIACFLLPSVLFWTSSLLKETPLFLCLGLVFWSVAGLLNDPKIKMNYIRLLICFIFLVYIKGYVIITLIPALIFVFFIVFTGRNWLWLKFIGVHVLCFVIAQQAHYFFRGGDFIYVLHKKQVDFYNVAYLRNAGSVVDIPPVTTPFSFLLHYPEAFALTYYRPFIWEANNIPSFLFSIENMAYLLLLLLTLVFHRKAKVGDIPILLVSSSFVLVLASVLGNCVPILGAILRYKVPALVFLVIVCLYFLDLTKIQKLVKK